MLKPVAINNILAFSFGVAFCTALLALAVYVPEPTPTTLFIFRVVLSIAAAGAISIIPDLFNVKIPYIRIGGASLVAAVVYFVNPPSILADPLEKRLFQVINEGRYLISRGNFDSALEKLRQAQVNNTNVVDIPFYLGVIEKRYLRYVSAENYFQASLKMLNDSGIAITDLSKADILYEIAMMQDGQRRFIDAYNSFILAHKFAPSGTYIEADIVFELGRLALFIWLEGKNEKYYTTYLEKSVTHFSFFLDRDWPHLQSKIWGNYHISCAYLELSRITEGDESIRHAKLAIDYAKHFTTEANTLKGQRKFEFYLAVYMAYNDVNEYLPGIPLACNSIPVDMTTYFPSAVKH